MEYDRSKLNFHEKQEEVWVATQTDSGNHGVVGVSPSEVGAGQLPGLDKARKFTVTKTILFKPSLAPIYGGPTLLEALWSEMDRLMEALMTGAEADDTCGRKECREGAPYSPEDEDICCHPDNGNRYRAAELAWVLAIVTDAYNPDVNKIRAAAVARWNEAQA
jgi:hypothetical protein